MNMAGVIIVKYVVEAKKVLVMSLIYRSFLIKNTIVA